MLRAPFAAFLLAGSISLGLAVAARAQAVPTAPIAVEHAWARATPGNVKTGVAYMTLVDHGPAPDRLVGAWSPVAGQVQLHSMSQDNGMMKMRAVDAIPVEPGRATELKPGGYHVMLLDLKQPLKEGDSFPMTLSFEKAGSVPVTVKVEKAGAMEPQAGPPAAGPGTGTVKPGMKM